MATDLWQQTCVPCMGDADAVSEAEIRELKPQIPDWTILEDNGEARLQRSYTFPDFQSALAFTVQVGEAAERVNHHPDLLTSWGKVTVTWWTHAISGLHRNDFIMAAQTDQIAARLRI